MFSRMLHVRLVLMTMDEVVALERSETKIDEHFNIPYSLTSILISNTFWSKLKVASSLMNPVCQCLGYWESDSSTLADTYACFFGHLKFLQDVKHS